LREGDSMIGTEPGFERDPYTPSRIRRPKVK
jgi:hypothetical protein